MKNSIYILVVSVFVIICLCSRCQNQGEETLLLKKEVSEVKSALQKNVFYKGVDLSYVNELEDSGVVYYEGLTSKDPYQIMKEHGANLVRLRLWHNPQWTNYSSFDDVKKSIKRTKDLGMNVLLDFHYSDNWTHPGQNIVPAAWNLIADNTPVLVDSVYNYTYATLVKLHKEKLLPALVQIGNETNDNIMMREGEALTPINWNRNIFLFNAGINAVKNFNSSFSTDIKTIIHLAKNPEDCDSWVNTAIAKGISDFDILGLSYYPQWHNYDITALGDFITHIHSTYNKKVMVVETGHIWTKKWKDNAHNLMSKAGIGFPDTPSPQLQKDFMVMLKQKVKEKEGLGVVYWEPAWVSGNYKTQWGTGSNWENVTFFDFNNRLMVPGGVDFLSEDNIKVVFKVDMERVDTEQGAFISGKFTKNDSDNWQIIPMKRKTGTNVYSFITFLNPRQAGGYYFLKDDDWSARETVPHDCSWKEGNNRRYSIPDKLSGTKVILVKYPYKWGRCDYILGEN